MKRFKFLKNIFNISAERYFKTAGKLFIYEGNYESALVLVNKTLDLDPRNVKALVLKGDILFCLNRDTEALKVLDKALSLNPAFIEAYVSKAGVLEALGRYCEGLNLCRRAMGLMDATQAYLLPTLYEQELILLIHLKKFYEARQLLRDAETILPGEEFQYLFKNYAGILNDELRKRSKQSKNRSRLAIVRKQAVDTP